MKRHSIAIVVAVDKNYAIGKNGDLPWRVPYDMRVFRHITKNNPVIMGRNTWESLPKPLAQRTNIIVSTSLKQSSVNNIRNSHPIFAVTSPEEAIAKAVENIDLHKEYNRYPSIMVIGGAQIFESFIGKADEIFISHLDLEADDPDSFFDKSWLKNRYRRAETRKHSASNAEDDLVGFTLEQYVRIDNPSPNRVNSVFSLDFFKEKDLDNSTDVGKTSKGESLYRGLAGSALI